MEDLIGFAGSYAQNDKPTKSMNNTRKISGPDPMAAAVGEGRQFGCL